MTVCSICNKKVSILCRNMCKACYVRLKRHGIIKNIEKPILPNKLTDIQLSYINGSLLGDGCIQYYNGKGSFRNLRARSDKSYLEWERNFLIDFCQSGVKDESYFDKRTNKNYYRSRFSTRTCSVFGELYEKWYPNGIKIIPKDLILTPLTMAIWFLDDGGISIKNNKPHLLEIKLATDGFSKEDVEFLSSLLRERYDKYYSVCNHEKHFIINASTMSARAIIKDIDAIIPDKIMDRKTIKWRNPLSKINEDLTFNGRGLIMEQQFLKNLNNELQKLFNERKSFSTLEICKKLNCFKMANGKIIQNRDRVLSYLNKYIQNKSILREKNKVSRRYIYTFADNFIILK